MINSIQVDGDKTGEDLTFPSNTIPRVSAREPSSGKRGADGCAVARYQALQTAI